MCTRGSNRALLRGPSTSPLGTQDQMPPRLRRVIAGLVAPMVLALLFIGRRPPGEAATWQAVLFMYVLAQVFYWFAALATRVASARLHRTSTPKLVLLMAGAAGLISFLCTVPFIYWHPFPVEYGWHDSFRDTLDAAVAGGGAFCLYRIIVYGVTWVPNNRWRGP